MKKSELKPKKPLRRKTPLARKKPDLYAVVAKALEPREPMRKKKPSVAAAQYAQRRALTIRSGGRCEIERYLFNAVNWVRCNNRADDPAHIYTRPKCGKARDLLDVVVHACRGCHTQTEGILGDSFARIPLARAQGAWNAILAHSKLGVDADDKLRIHIATVGPRPEKGIPPYE